MRVTVGRPVLPVNDVKKIREKENTQELQLHQIGETKSLERSPIFVLLRHRIDIINYAKFGQDRPRGFQPASS